VTFAILPLDEKPELANWATRVELSELPNYGKTEIVQVLIPLETLPVEDAAPAIRNMLTNNGGVSMLKESNQLLIVDAAGNIRRIADALKVDPVGVKFLFHRFKYLKSAEEAEKLKKLLADPDTTVTVIPARDADKDPRFDPRDPKKIDGDAKRGSTVVIKVDATSNSITITGPAEKITLARGIIEKTDIPQRLTSPLWEFSEPEIRKYAVPSGKAEDIAKKIKAEIPAVRVITLSSSDEIIVMCTAAEHAAVVKAIGKVLEPKQETITHKCKSITAAELAEKLGELFPAAGRVWIKVTVDESTNSLTITGTSTRLTEVRRIIDVLDPRK
jgi:type II secretory pathway component GspD/PulD (secretin)